MLVFLNYTNSQIRNSTVLDSVQVNYENSLTPSITQLISLNRTIHIQSFIVKDSFTETGFDMNDLFSAIVELNNTFSKVGVTFKLIDTTVIDNYQLNYIRKGDTENDIVSQYFQLDVINLYIVGFLNDEENRSTCGYTYYPSANRDLIFIRKSCFSSGYFIELIGHFFNLYNTHETAFGNEPVQRDSCLVKGDLCCDTPADPDLASKVTLDCSYNATVTDHRSSFYIPQTENYMSSALDKCKCFLSDDQLVRAINCMTTSKNHLK